MQIEEGWGGYLECLINVYYMTSTGTEHLRWMNLCYKNVMGQNKIMCIVITESIGKMDQEVLFWAHFCMDAFIILCKKKKPNCYLLQSGALAPFK